MKTYKFEYTVDGVKHIETDYYPETLIAIRDEVNKKYGIPKSEMPIYFKAYLFDYWIRL